MNLINLLKQINRMFPAPPYHTEEEERTRVKKIVSRFAQGNVYLQLGRYLSGKEVEQRKSRLASYNFMPRKYS